MGKGIIQRFKFVPGNILVAASIRNADSVIFLRLGIVVARIRRNMPIGSSAREKEGFREVRSVSALILAHTLSPLARSVQEIDTLVIN